MRSHKPDILILEETRVPSTLIDKITAKTYFNAKMVTEATGFSGGIWILWYASNLRLELLSLDA